MSNAFLISGQPNVGRIQPTQDAVILGSPMFAEDYDQDQNLQVDNADLVGGRSSDELFDGTRILGYSIDASGLGNNKVLKYDSTQENWVFADPTGTSNLADLADVEDGTPDASDTIKWSGSEWQFSGVTLLMMDQPIGSGFKVGTTDSTGELVIMGVEDSQKSLVFKSQVGELLQERWSISVDEDVDSGALVIESSNSMAMKIHTATGRVEMESIQIMGHSSAPTQVAGGLYFNTTDETLYFSKSAS